jgi:mannose-6-phosphate isomerase-like protein (cupin superfamily)
MTTRVLRVDRDFVHLPIVEGTRGEARAVVWPGMGARHRSMHYVALPGGAATVALRHPSEAVYYVIRGHGTIIDLDTGASHPLRPGAFALITPDNGHRFTAATGSELVFVGGPCPPDPALYEEMRPVSGA